MMREIYKPSISAHACQRFRERVGEATNAQIDEFLLTPEMRNWLAWGVCRVINYKGLNIIVDEGVIVTVMFVRAGASFRIFQVREPADG